MAQSQNVSSDIRVFNIENQTLQKTHDLRTYAAISFLRLSPDGRRLLSFIPEGRSCHYFNTQTGEALHTIDPMNPPTLRGLDHTDINVIHDLVWLGNERAVGLATLYAGRGRPESEMNT